MAGCTNNADNHAGDGSQAENDQNENRSKTGNTIQPADHTDSYTFSVDGQSFEIVPLYDEILNYTANMKENPLDHNETFEATVIEPLQDKMPENPSDYFYKTDEFDKLEGKTNKLVEHQDTYNSMIEEALTRSVEELPGEDITVYVAPIRPENKVVIEETGGVTGITLSEERFILRIDPSLSEDVLKYTAAHEYHHTIVDGHSSGTLLGAILTEGKAEIFADIINPDVNVNRLEDLSNEEEKKVLDTLDGKARTTWEQYYNDFYYGNAEKGIPRWSNYKIGTLIMENYLKQHRDKSITEWTDKTAEQIVQESDYSELLEKADIVDSNG